MKIQVVGLNYRKTPLEIRELLAFDKSCTERALALLKQNYPMAEFVLLSTCNRIEIYCADKRIGGLEDTELVEFIAYFHNVRTQAFSQYAYVYRNKDAVQHLFSVASGLDSMVIGETQIIAQVKQSYQYSCKSKANGRILNKLFHYAFHTAKKVQNETDLSSGRYSIPGVAVELISQLFENIQSVPMLVIGAGEMGQLVMHNLINMGCRNMTIVNRNRQRALDAAQRNGIFSCSWDQIAQKLGHVNVVVGSASVQQYIVDKAFVKKAMKKHFGGSLIFIDIGVPRNFDPAINELDDVYVYNIDDLTQVVEETRKQRQEAVADALKIVNHDVVSFMNWFSARDIGPLISNMKEEFAQIAQMELDSFFVGEREHANCRGVMEPMVKKVVNRLLHCVIKNVYTVAENHSPGEAAEMVESIVTRARQIAANSKPDQQKERNEKQRQ